MIRLCWYESFAGPNPSGFELIKSNPSATHVSRGSLYCSCSLLNLIILCIQPIQGILND